MIETAGSLPLKEIFTAAGPLIKGLVDTFITPRLEKLNKKLSLDRKKYYVPTEEHFKEYCYRTYKKVSVINTLVFKDTPQLLKELFIPLTIKQSADEKVKIKIEEFPIDVLEQYEKILIMDIAGMGKSTLMKKFFLDIVDKTLGIPIFIELRRLSKERKLLTETHDQLNAINKEFDTTLLLELIMEGGFIFIFDGYDEISLDDRNVVTTDIQTFIEKAFLNKFIITSRPESSLSSFLGFQWFNIAPLRKEEAFDLLRKYDKQGETSFLLIEKLKEKEMTNIDEFLTNPLLVSLLFMAFDHKHVIPFKKHLFYRQVYDASFESFDLTKGGSFVHSKCSGLETDDFHRVLRHIGYQCFKLQRIEFTKDALLEIIRKSRSFNVGLTFNESDLLRDLITTVPLFTLDGNYYRWAHRSLQEYFAAQFIYLDTKNQREKILEMLYEHKEIRSFYNILELYYDIDYKTFRNVIVYRLLKEFKEHSERRYTGSFPEIPASHIEDRIALVFLTKFFLLLKGKEYSLDGHAKFKLAMAKAENIVDSNFSEFDQGPSMFNTQQCTCLFWESKKKIIFHILLSKKNPLIVSSSHIRERLYLNEPLIVLTLASQREYDIIELTDDKRNALNSKHNFKLVNDLIYCSNLIPVRVNTSEAFKQLKEIEESLRAESDENFLIEGI